MSKSEGKGKERALGRSIMSITSQALLPKAGPGSTLAAYGDVREIKNEYRVAVRVLRGDAGAITHKSGGINDGPIAGTHNEYIIHHRRSPVQMDACKRNRRGARDNVPYETFLVVASAWLTKLSRP